MATRNQVIEALFIGKNFNDAISKIEPAHLRDDLRQEVVLVICEWPDEKVIDLHTEGKLEFYVVRVMMNMVCNKYHPFHKKFRAINIEYKDNLSETWQNAIETQDDFWEPQRVFDDNRVDLVGMKEMTDDPDAFKQTDRETQEELEDYTIEQIESLDFYDRELIKLYMEVGTFRAMERETRIPFVSCYKNIQKTIRILKAKAAAKSPKPVFTKSELNFIQNGTNKKESGN